ncbi:hypothetical protein [Corallococcus macrosporus]|uniref:FtsH ternary system domain-containing protein n=1 Tax=Myxococcus fulvus (strain ATCC BAA-855 / HW-1) TaxID=483219 RepID=F8CIT1_MYXFH|nr:hypothetical protein [Corallococcus macrosporus]AEI66347.1 hypothetical protein LILAB_22250 [Corallococcus macrosporus]
MIRVAPTELELLTLARAVVGLGQYAPVEDLLRNRHDVPAKLSPGAMHVLRDTLAKGGVLALVRCGGWRQQHTVRDGQPRSGRLWERHAPPALRFSPLSFRVLRWMLAQPLTKHGAMPLQEDGAPTLADELVLFLCCRLVAGSPCAPALGAQPLFRRSALCWLGFPEQFGTHRPELDAAAFAPLLADGAWLLEALRLELAQRWRALEESKRTITSPAEALALGTAQEAVLTAFLDAVDGAGRRDLAGFLLEAARPLLEQPASRWVEGLSTAATLSSRAEAARAAAAVLRILGRLARWDAEHRAVRFFDDDYDTAQRLLSEWSAFGEAGFRRAEDHARHLATALTSASGAAAAPPPSTAGSAP